MVWYEKTEGSDKKIYVHSKVNFNNLKFIMVDKKII